MSLKESQLALFNYGVPKRYLNLECDRKPSSFYVSAYDAEKLNVEKNNSNEVKIKSSLQEKWFKILKSGKFLNTPVRVIVSSTPTDEIAMSALVSIFRGVVNSTPKIKNGVIKSVDDVYGKNHLFVDASTSFYQYAKRASTTKSLFIHNIFEDSTRNRIQDVRDFIKLFNCPVIIAVGTENPVDFYNKVLRIYVDKVIHFKDTRIV